MAVFWDDYHFDNPLHMNAGGLILKQGVVFVNILIYKYFNPAITITGIHKRGTNLDMAIKVYQLTKRKKVLILEVTGATW